MTKKEYANAVAMIIQAYEAEIIDKWKAWEAIRALPKWRELKEDE